MTRMTENEAHKKRKSQPPGIDGKCFAKKPGKHGVFAPTLFHHFSRACSCASPNCRSRSLTMSLLLPSLLDCPGTKIAVPFVPIDARENQCDSLADGQFKGAQPTALFRQL